METVALKELKPAFRRQGNKYPMRNILIPLIPAEHKRYVELFSGSGAIFWNKPKAEENVLNDLDKDVYNQYMLLKRAPLDSSKYPLHLDTVSKIKTYYSKKPETIAEKLIWYKIKTGNGFSGKPVNHVNEIYKNSNPVNILKNLADYKRKLKDVKIEKEDYEKIVDGYDDKDTFFFIDPPYENTSPYYGYAEDLEFDYERLGRVLDKIQGKFLMTINDSPRMRKLFKRFHVVAVDVPTVWGHYNGSDMIRKELIVTNYRIPKKRT